MFKIKGTGRKLYFGRNNCEAVEKKPFTFHVFEQVSMKYSAVFPQLFGDSLM